MTALLRAIPCCVALAAATWPGEALPCSPPGCGPPMRPPGGERYPENVPGLPVRFLRVPRSIQTRLVDLDTGAERAGELALGRAGWEEFRVFVPVAPVPPGRYALQGFVQCSAGSEVSEYLLPMEILPGAPLPTQLGAVQVRALGVYPEVQLSGAECVAPPQGATAVVEVSPSPELVPFLHATSWVLEIDGRVRGATQPGAELSPQDARCTGVHPIQLVSAKCGPDAGFDLTPEIHQAQLRAVIAGLDGGPAPVSFAIDLRCDAGVAVGPPPTECELWSVAGPPPPVAPDAGQGPTPSVACGCSLAPGNAALVAALALWLRRRRHHGKAPGLGAPRT